MKKEDLLEYTMKLLKIYNLQRGGYPFAADDLTLEEWIDLGLLKDALKPALTCPLLRKKQ